MRFYIVNDSLDILRGVNVIPLQYCNFIHTFSTRPPLFFTTPSLDILYQDYSFNACTIRSIIFFVREKTILQAKSSSIRTVIKSVVSGGIGVQFDGGIAADIGQGEYLLSTVGTDSCLHYLNAGTHITAQFEYPSNYFELLMPSNHSPENWVYKGSISKRQEILQRDIVNHHIVSNEREQQFFRSMREFMEDVVRDYDQQMGFQLDPNST
ncbi:hypothetical protein [Chitinophaga ginsengisoli]|uniref:Uncharacterized protein n=1 Tax=Chitinophaga ginsengisoli TaxID=363837 RepID=A0A2P8G2I5_9BACT|nr:hypothetical protein [Chitinophaga ginsengisoli]PSL28085.1 hypothetical protein CLV42_1084 [Chitinophaga ginsengisoli]